MRARGRGPVMRVGDLYYPSAHLTQTRRAGGGRNSVLLTNVYAGLQHLVLSSMLAERGMLVLAVTP